MAYPKLSIVHVVDGEDQLNYLDMNSPEKELRVYFHIDENTKYEIYPTDEDLKISSLDNNVTVVFKNNKNKLILKKEGTATLLVYYSPGGMSRPELYSYIGIKLSVKSEFLVYSTFFRDNYNNILPQFDRQCIDSNSFAKVMFRTLMEFFDILYAYQCDISDMRDPIHLKYKFLNVLGNSIGFGSFRDFDDPNPGEAAAIRLYRELLASLIDLLQIRGTKLSYQLFFGALGYDIELFEYWFDDNGHLIEIDPYDGAASTFFAYTVDGTPLEEKQVPHDDPRRLSSPNNPVTYCGKSNYIKTVFTPKPGFESVVDYSFTQRLLLKEYLDILRPLHIQYLPESVRVKLPGVTDDIIQQLLETNNSFNTVRLFMPLLYEKTYHNTSDFLNINQLMWENTNAIKFSGNEYGYSDIPQNDTSNKLVFYGTIDNWRNDAEIARVLFNFNLRINGTNVMSVSKISVVVNACSIVIVGNSSIDTCIHLNATHVVLAAPSIVKHELEILYNINFLSPHEMVIVSVETINILYSALQSQASNEHDVAPIIDRTLVSVDAQYVNVVTNNEVVVIEKTIVVCAAKTCLSPMIQKISMSINETNNFTSVVIPITDNIIAWDWNEADAISITLTIVNKAIDTKQFQIGYAYREIYSIKTEKIYDIRPHRVNSSTRQIDSYLPYNYDNTSLDAGGRIVPPDPGRLDYAGEIIKNTWKNSGGGMVVENLINLIDSFLLSTPVYMRDVIQSMPTYDSKTRLFYDGYSYDENTRTVSPAQPSGELQSVPPIHWEDSQWMGDVVFTRPTDKNLTYDAGRMLDELYPNVVRYVGSDSSGIGSFKDQYNAMVENGYASAAIKQMLMSAYAITERQYNTILQYL